MTRRVFSASTAGAALAAAERPPVLSPDWTAARLGEALLPRAQWRPFPTAADRAAWEGLPPDLRARTTAAAQALLNQPWPSLPASVYLDFRRNGNRSRYESLHRPRRARIETLVLAECCEGQGRFLDEILNGLWLLSEESSWVLPAHIGPQKAGSGLPDTTEPIVDLFAAETGALIAWADYLLAQRLEELSPLVRPRLLREVRSRILDPCFARTDFGWMGFHDRPVNNWNPWINSNWLAANLLLEPDERRRTAATEKCLRSLDRFLAFYADDGGCDEGPSYWGRAGASLFDCLEVLHSASAGKIDFFARPLIGEIGRYIVRTHIHEDWYVNFADASARLRPAGDLIFRYGRRVRDEGMQLHGAWLAARGEKAAQESLGRALPAYFNAAVIRKAPARPPLVKEAWLPGVQVMTARRQDGSSGGLYLAAQGGHNAESHNHNDVGNFIVFSDGRPALIDVGVETYTAKTFSRNRYDIWTMQSAWHNCPTINGHAQLAGREFAARDASFRSSASRVDFQLDLAPAYPREAGVREWRRSWSFDRAANAIEISEDFKLDRSGGRVELNLICPLRAELRGAHVLIGDRLDIEFPVALAAEIDEHEAEDARLKPVWSGRVWRVRLVSAPAPAAARWTLRLTQPPQHA